MMDTLIRYLIYIHAVLGGLSLFAGLLALIANKGHNLHKVAGKIFSITLGLGILIALFVSRMPGHESAFLFSIGIFSLYLVFSGYRSIRAEINRIDKTAALLMGLTGLYMVVRGSLLPLLNNTSIHIILTVFGLLGLVFALQDFRDFQKGFSKGDKVIRRHIGRMVGAYISSWTAFLVVNSFLPWYIGWFGPTIIGTAFIFIFSHFYFRKFSSQGQSL